jgi:hypothetical protein
MKKATIAAGVGYWDFSRYGGGEFHRMQEAREIELTGAEHKRHGLEFVLDGKKLWTSADCIQAAENV